MRRLKICMVTNNYKPYSGGVVSSIQALTQELQKQGHKVIIITLDFNKSCQPEPDIERVKCVGHFTYKNNPMAVPINIKKQLINLLSQHDPDIVHVHHPFLLGAAALPVARNLKIPVLFTHHSLYEHYAHYLPLPQKITKSVIRHIVRKFWQNIDHAIVPTQSIKIHILEQKIKTPLSVIPSGLLPIFINSIPTKKTLLNNRPIELLTVSRFVPEKNIFWLIDMFYKLIKYVIKNNHDIDYRLKLIGYGSLLESLKNYAYNTLKLPPEKINFVCKPSKQELVQAYQKTDIFIFSSQSETQGLVLAEAMSQRTPVIALSGPAIADIVQDNINGYVVHDQTGMINKIQQISSDQNLFDKLQEGAYNTSKAYNPAIIANNISNLYYQLIAPDYL